MQINSRARWIPLALAVLAAVVLFMAGTGSRIGLWDFRFGFTLIKWGAYIGIAAVVSGLGMLAIVRPAGVALAVLVGAVVVGLTTVIMPWRWQQMGAGAPPIHDITTDLGDPPAFEAILPLRADAPNAATYEGSEISAQQRAAYPDIGPLYLERTPGAAFSGALETARGMGWEIVNADSARGRIEAVATTKWFGFKDDVVVRIAEDGSRSRVDVRSVSRVGRGDMGTNAKRIREFLVRLAP